MRLFSYSSIIFLVIAFSGCSLFINLGQLEEEAEAAYEDGRNEEALELYKSLIDAQASREDVVDGKAYERTGILAYRLDKDKEAIDYLEKARQSEEIATEGLIILARLYRQIDNLSLEIRTLSHYVNNYPGGDEIEKVRNRYFETLVESRNWERAKELWQDLSDDQYQDESLLEGYFIVNRELENDQITEELAKKLLELNEYNKPALNWLARKYYYKGIERYNHEMQAYQENRTQRQYAQLMEAWPVIHRNLRISRNYFLKLYDIKPSAEYARFLANIYERFDDDRNARYYRERAD